MTVYVLWDVSLCAGRLGSGCQDLAADGFTQLVVHFIMFFFVEMSAFVVNKHLHLNYYAMFRSQ